MRPRRSDKGAIVLHFKENHSLSLWAKRDLDEWMLLIAESIERIKLRRAAGPQVSQLRHLKLVAHGDDGSDMETTANANGFTKSANGFYENANLAKSCDTNAANRRNILSNDQQNHADHNNNSNNININTSNNNNINIINQDTDTLFNTSTVNKFSLTRDSADSNSVNNSTLNSHQDTAKVSSSRSSSGSRRPMRTLHETRPNSAKTEDQTEIGTVAQVVSDAAALDQVQVNGMICGEPLSGPLQAHRNLPSYVPIYDDRNKIASQSEALDSAQPRVEGRRRNKLDARPLGNLIRRDESWQSLVSLSQIGRTNGVDVPAGGPRAPPLYAPHAAGLQRDAGRVQGPIERSQRQHLLSIESNATPMRNRPPIRQQSMQAPDSARLVPIRATARGANSFDLPSLPTSPSLQNQQQQASSSYQNKLLQLRLLHNNNNNVDYVRQLGVGGQDPQVYAAAESVTTNPYYYYSMRSNLKSAASEFSFIRPSSSGFQHQSRSIAENNPLFAQNCQQRPQPRPEPIHRQETEADRKLFAHPLDRKGVEGQPSSTDRLTLSELIAPSRELPLKPNKRRDPAVSAVVRSQPDKGSFGSGIAGFFRRAFSKRSKRRPKLVESCSSSLAAFESNFEAIQISQSAFSTGSKSARTAERAQLQQQSQIYGQQPEQPQRMVDLIEAFASHTNPADPREAINGDSNLVQSGEIRGAKHQHLIAPGSQATFQRPTLNNMASPLHKSSSMSASIEFGGLNELSSIRRHPGQRMRNDEMGGQASIATGARSSKVMSVNLTPLFARKEASFEPSQPMSPRNVGPLGTGRLQMPRPSSIYGQPSLIASPVIGAGRAREVEQSQFGFHRSSLQAGANVGARDRITSLNMDLRRQQGMKMAFLDTTREVAEEIPSPTAETLSFVGGPAGTSANYAHERSMANSPMLHQHFLSNLQQQQRHAIVSPILHSPTMGAIYDNHPMSGPGISEFQPGRLLKEPTFSHYDNHRSLQADFLAGPHSNSRDSQRPRLEETISTPLVLSTHPPETFYTPTREYGRRIANGKLADVGLDDERVIVHRSKPAAIVTPSTPSRLGAGPYGQSHYVHRGDNNLQQQQQQQQQPAIEESAGFTNHQYHVQNSPLRPQHAHHSNGMLPLPARRFINHAAHCQQSPLVNRQTRVLMRADGVQATILSEPPAVDSVQEHNDASESKLNTSGASSANLDSGLAASSLHAIDTNAFPSSTINLAGQSSRMAPDSKTSSISSPLSRATPEDVVGTKTESKSVDEPEAKMLSSTQPKASRASSSGSSDRSTLSSGRQQNGTRSPSVGADYIYSRRSSKDEASQSSSSGGSRSQASSRKSNPNLRKSSTEHSDELCSQTGSIDDPEERDWVNSRLTQGNQQDSS